MLMPQPPVQSGVCQAVSESLARTLTVPASTCTSSAPGRLISILLTTCPSSPGDATCAVVTVTYRYKDSPVLPLVSLFDTSWVPDELRSSSTVALKAS
ncbi:hypothetical protein D3C86_2041440 [compost metagenome]